MATGSLIGYEENGKVHAVRCENGGVLVNNGTILLTNYNDLEKVKKMVSLGDLFRLAQELEPKRREAYNIKLDGDEVKVEKSKKLLPITHNLNSAQQGVSLFLERDLEKDGHIGEIVRSRDSLPDAFSQLDYFYVFHDGAWLVYDRFNETGWISLETALTPVLRINMDILIILFIHLFVFLVTTIVGLVKVHLNDNYENMWGLAAHLGFALSIITTVMIAVSVVIRFVVWLF